MWKKISTDLLEEIYPGRIITNNPDSEDFYEVQYIHWGYVNAIPANGKIAIKVFPERELIRGNWWVRYETKEGNTL
jgi:hypothetical protein